MENVWYNLVKNGDQMINGWGERWLAYFDILGFSDLIEKKGYSYDFLLSVYYDALREACQAVQLSDHIKRVHFSDTFIFYSEDGTGKSFAWIQSIAKNMIRRCLVNRIPLRGAIAFGNFFSDPQDGIYLGTALIDAHREAETQDWIGLILAETAAWKISEYQLHPERFEFPIVDVPVNKMKNQLARRYAYDFHSSKINPDQIIGSLESMKRQAPDKAKHKYANTIKHISDFNTQRNSAEKFAELRNML